MTVDQAHPLSTGSGDDFESQVSTRLLVIWAFRIEIDSGYNCIIERFCKFQHKSS